MESETIIAIAAILKEIAWPITISVILFYSRNEVGKFVCGVKKINLSSKSIELELAQAYERIKPTSNDRNMYSEKIFVDIIKEDRILNFEGRISSEIIKDKMIELSREYEFTRASKDSSDERTMELEFIVSKMRLLAMSSHTHLVDFIISDEQGKKLAAIIILQLNPHHEFYTWLGNVVRNQPPFLVYHACLAILRAARLCKTENVKDLSLIIDAIYSRLSKENPISDRYYVISKAKKTIDSLTSKALCE